ncbi:MAG: glycosyltransferase [Caulobacteraceae bacterium]|nr:glycosyltransferase [Caulobacteraceae bacterium]
MSTSLAELDLASWRGAEAIRANHARLLVLLRLGDTPIGKLELPSAGGVPDGRELRQRIAARFGYDIWTQRALAALPSPATARAPSATVVICTRERPDDLRKCLGAVCALPDDGQDVLIVDNNPRTTATFDVAREFPQVRYALEDQPGLNAARNRALREARGAVLAFVDDDAVVDRNWLRALLRPFEDPEVQAVTGLTMPLELETPAQELFESLTGFSRRGFKRRVFVWPPHDPLSAGAVGAGANMAIRRSVVDVIGEFDPALDAGTASESGGDHEFFSRILRRGYRIVYEPGALNWHRHRRTDEELHRALYGYGVGAYASWTRTLMDGEWGVVRQAWWWLSRQQAPGVLRLMFRRGSRFERRLQLGELLGCLRGPGRYLAARRKLRVA